MAIKIRRARIEDLKQVQDLSLLLFKKETKEYDEALDENWTFSKIGTKFFSDHIQAEKNCTLIAEDGEQVIGYLAGGLNKKCSWRKIGKIASLKNLFIKDEYRGQGVGTELVKMFKDWCREKKIQRIDVTAAARNHAGINFYKKQGFEDYHVTLELSL